MSKFEKKYETEEMPDGTVKYKFKETAFLTVGNSGFLMVIVQLFILIAALFGTIALMNGGWPLTVFFIGLAFLIAKFVAKQKETTVLLKPNEGIEFGSDFVSFSDILEWGMKPVGREAKWPGYKGKVKICSIYVNYGGQKVFVTKLLPTSLATVLIKDWGGVYISPEAIR